MPESKKRKKNGKKVGNGEERRRRALEESDAPTHLTLQDLINVVAYQEYVKDGTIIAPDAKINIPEVLPVTVGEGEDKRQVGVATPIPGEDGQHVSIEITDPDTLAAFQGPVRAGDYSLAEENTDGGQ